MYNFREIKKDPKVIEAGKKLDMSDLDKDPVVSFQKYLDPWFSQFMCFVFPSIIPFFMDLAILFLTVYQQSY